MKTQKEQKDRKKHAAKTCGKLSLLKSPIISNVTNNLLLKVFKEQH